MLNRSYALDALRGTAIVLMVLSGAVAFGILPSWMYHAQVPPPAHVFNPDIPGITWVDLVFPFFLFAMGAAFPFSLRRKLEQGVAPLRLIVQAVLRGGQLAFFAIFIQHMYPWSLSQPQDARSWLLALSCFALLFPMFMRLPSAWSRWLRAGVKVAAYGLALLLMLTVSYANGRSFSLYYSNIIILVLANMALFGSVIYILTYRHPMLRLALIPFVLAILLGSTIEGSITKAIYDFTPLAWFYKFNYIKYLCLIIPGSVAGEYLYEQLSATATATAASSPVPLHKGARKWLWGLLFCALLLIVGNVCLLYGRYLWCNLGLSALLLLAARGLAGKIKTPEADLYKKLCAFGAYLLLLGLFLEAFQGGIKKDHATFSYYFVTGGLACYALIAFRIFCDDFQKQRWLCWLTWPGQNPMIAYVCTSLFTVPLLSLVSAYSLFTAMESTPLLGFFRGLILTGIAVVVTMFFTKIKWFWRT